MFIKVITCFFTGCSFAFLPPEIIRPPLVKRCKFGFFSFLNVLIKHTLLVLCYSGASEGEHSSYK